MVASHGTGSTGVTLGKLNYNDPRDIAEAVHFLWGQRYLKSSLEQRAAKNAAFLDGEQYLEFDPELRRLRVGDQYADAENVLIYNIIRPLVQQKLARMAVEESVWSVPAFTSDEFDQMVSRFSNDLLAWYFTYGLEMPREIERLFNQVMCSDITFIEPSWNPTKGERKPITLDTILRSTQGIPPELAERQNQEDIDLFRGLVGFNPGHKEGLRQTVQQFAGDLEFNIRSVFDAVWWPHLPDKFDFESDCIDAMLISVVMSPEQVAHRYQLDIDEVLRHRDTSEVEELRTKIVGAWSAPWIDMPIVNEAHDNGVIVHTLHVAKHVSPNNPDGATGVVLGSMDEAIRVGKLGNRRRQLPFYAIYEYDSNLVPWGKCSMDDAVPAQMEINDAATDESEFRKYKIDPIWLVDTNDGNPEREALESKHGVYEVDGIKDKAPSALKLPGEGFENEKTKQFNQRFLHDTFATPDVSLGNTRETKAKSGVAIDRLQREANLRLKNIGRRFNRAMAWAGSMYLELLQDNAVDERLTAITGRETGAREFRAWSAADLRPRAYGQDPNLQANVATTVFSHMPRTEEDIQEVVFALMEMKVIRPGEHDQIITEAFGLRDWRSVMDRGRIGRDKAVNRTMAWRSGRPTPDPNPYDDHKEFVPIYEEFVTSDDFARLPPFIQQQVHQHLLFHQQGQYDRMAETSVRQQYALMKMSRRVSQEALANGDSNAAAVLFAQSTGQLPGPKENKDSGDRSQAA